MRIPVAERLVATLSVPSTSSEAKPLLVRVYRLPKDADRPILPGQGVTANGQVRLEAEPGTPPLHVELEGDVDEGAVELVEPWRDQTLELRPRVLEHRAVRVMDETGAPRVGLTVSFARFYRGPLTARTDSQGVARVAVARSERVRAQVMERDMASSWASVSDDSIVPLTVVSLGTLDVRNESGDLHALISLRVQTGDAPVSERRLFFLKGGRVRIERLSPGTYYLSLDDVGGASAKERMRVEVKVEAAAVATVSLR